MARENVKSLSALAKISDVNRSQLSTIWNQKDPNPMLATFDRLVVALGAERDFVVVNIYDTAVAEAIVAGGAEVQAKREAKIRHLHSVPPASSRGPVTEPDARAVAEAVDAAANEKLAEVTAKINELYKKNVELEKLRDDQAAELVRQSGANATLERLRAADAAEIARLTQQNQKYEQRHAADAAETARARQRSRELEQQHAHAVAEAARMLARNSELERLHQRNVTELARLRSEGGGWSWIEKALLAVASVATGIAGTIIYYEKRRPKP
jgi:transcriptional regulator with XRE-family HTH domain